MPSERHNLKTCPRCGTLIEPEMLGECCSTPERLAETLISRGWLAMKIMVYPKEGVQGWSWTSPHGTARFTSFGGHDKPRADLADYQEKGE